MIRTILRQARENKGLTTRQAAALLGIDQALVSKFENGQRIPARAQLEPLSAVLGIDPDALSVLWLKEKILQLVWREPMAEKALQAALDELQPQRPAPPQQAALQQLLDEMEALKHKFGNLRNP